MMQEKRGPKIEDEIICEALRLAGDEIGAEEARAAYNLRWTEGRRHYAGCTLSACAEEKAHMCASDEEIKKTVREGGVRRGI
jgi:hypothetical protein